MSDDKDLDLIEDDEDEIEFDEDDAPEPEDYAPEPEKKDDRADELAAIAKECDDLREERDRIAQERDDAAFEAKNANYQAVNAYISRCNADLKKEKETLSGLKGDLEEARINGDTDAAKKLTHSINEKEGLIGEITGQITKYSPLNVKPEKGAVTTKATTPKVEAENPILKMARDWESENTWYNNPKYAEKREYIEALAKKRAATYDASKLSFWSYIDREVEAYDSRGKKESAPRRTPPAVRPISNNGVSKQVTSKTKADEAIKKETYAMLERRGIDKSHVDYKKIRNSYYRTAEKFAAEGKLNG